MGGYIRGFMVGLSWVFSAGNMSRIVQFLILQFRIGGHRKI